VEKGVCEKEGKNKADFTLVMICYRAACICCGNNILNFSDLAASCEHARGF